MNAHDAIKTGWQMADFISTGYISDLSEQELMHRPAPKANHIAWQLGHLVAAEHKMVEDCFPGSMPKLPAGFAEKYAKETASSDDPADFVKKDEVLKIYQEQRAGAEAKLNSLSEADLDKATPEAMQGYAPTVGSLFSLLGTHWVMHAGQWAVVRRQLGRDPMF
jgi:uncharacterized damage-inducible protein DinB